MPRPKVSLIDGAQGKKYRLISAQNTNSEGSYLIKASQLLDNVGHAYNLVKYPDETVVYDSTTR